MLKRFQRNNGPLRWPSLQFVTSSKAVVHLSSRFLKVPSLPQIIIGESPVATTNSVRDLGVIIDSTLAMKEHVRSVTKSSSFALHKISWIRKYLDKKASERLIHAFVTSRLDYCNSLLFGLPASDIAKLQRIQNSAARLVSRTKYRDHIQPVLFSLHWLPVAHRIKFKLLLLTYKILHELAPVYLSEIITPYQSNRTLRSSSKNLLCQPVKGRTAFYGDRAFS